MAITRKRISRRKFIAAAGAVLGAVALTGCSLTNDRPLGSLPTVTLTLANTAPPTPSATVTPIPEIATPSPTPRPTETPTPTPEPTATKEVMVIHIEGLTPESRDDIAEGKLELDPEVAKEVNKSLWSAFLNDGWVNQSYFNKYFPGSLGNYPEFMRQLKAKDYQMPAGLKIPRPIGYS